VVKWSQRFRATGSAAAKKRGWQRPYAVAGEREWLLARLAEKPDLTLRALQAVATHYAAAARRSQCEHHIWGPLSPMKAD